MSCKYCGQEMKSILWNENSVQEVYVESDGCLSVSMRDRRLDGVTFKINFCPMCGESLKQRLTPAQENAYKGSPRDSKPNKVYGVVDTPKDAVQPVFHIGDKIRFKSTGEIEKISTISHGGRFINGVNSNDVELVKES